MLAARERRQASLAAPPVSNAAATIFVSLNIPGADKTPPGADVFFAAMLARLLQTFAPATIASQASDALGPYAIVAVAVDPAEAKRRCVLLEASEPCARLVDLDVYAPGGEQVDRARLGLPGRACLVCAQAAVDCIRAGRHDIREVIDQAHALLANFRP